MAIEIALKEDDYMSERKDGSLRITVDSKVYERHLPEGMTMEAAEEANGAVREALKAEVESHTAAVIADGVTDGSVHSTLIDLGDITAELTTEVGTRWCSLDLIMTRHT